MNSLEAIISDIVMDTKSEYRNMIEDFLNIKLPKEYHRRSLETEKYMLTQNSSGEIFIHSPECGILNIYQLEELSRYLTCPRCGKSIHLFDNWASTYITACPECVVKDIETEYPGFDKVAKYIENIRDMAISEYGSAIAEIGKHNPWEIYFFSNYIRISPHSEFTVNLTIPRIRPVVYLTHRETIQKYAALLSKYNTDEFRISELCIPSGPITRNLEHLKSTYYSSPAFYYDHGRISTGGIGMVDSETIKEVLKTIPQKIVGQAIEETTIEQMRIPTALFDFISKYKKILLKELKTDGSIMLENNKTSDRTTIYLRKNHLICHTVEMADIPTSLQYVGVVRY